MPNHKSKIDTVGDPFLRQGRLRSPLQGAIQNLKSKIQNHLPRVASPESLVPSRTSQQVEAFSARRDAGREEIGDPVASGKITLEDAARFEAPAARQRERVGAHGVGVGRNPDPQARRAQVEI